MPFRRFHIDANLPPQLAAGRLCAAVAEPSPVNIREMWLVNLCEKTTVHRFDSRFVVSRTTRRLFLIFPVLSIGTFYFETTKAKRLLSKVVLNSWAERNRIRLEIADVLDSLANQEAWSDELWSRFDDLLVIENGLHSQQAANPVR
jgi:hypothetical protein